MARRGYEYDDQEDVYVQDREEPLQFDVRRPLTKEEWIQENMDCINNTYHALLDYLTTFGMPHILNNLAFDDFCDVCYRYSFR